MTDYEPGTTHLLTELDEDRAASTPSVKIFKALAHGAWVLSVDWLYACEQEDKRVDERNYVMRRMWMGGDGVT